jgi:hypothetical protein
MQADVEFAFASVLILMAKPAMNGLMVGLAAYAAGRAQALKILRRSSSSSLSCSAGSPTSHSYKMYLDGMAADRRTSHSRNPGRYTRAMHSHKARTTKDPSRTPSQGPSTAIRSQSPNLPNPNLPSPNPTRGPNPSHRPNRSQAKGLSNYHHLCRNSAPRERLRRRNQKRLLTGQKSAKRHRKFRRYERTGLSLRSLRNCVLHSNARSYRSCRMNATGHR